MQIRDIEIKIIDYKSAISKKYSGFEKGYSYAFDIMSIDMKITNCRSATLKNIVFSNFIAIYFNEVDLKMKIKVENLQHPIAKYDL